MSSFAYIDGTTGGLVVQLLLGGLVGGFVVVKLAARSLLDKILRRKYDYDAEDLEEPADRAA
jgi:hypothetical protein